MIARKHFTFSAYCAKYEELETALFEKTDSAGSEAQLHDFLVMEVADDVDGEAICRSLQGKVKSLRGLKEMTDEEVEALELQECECEEPTQKRADHLAPDAVHSRED